MFNLRSYQTDLISRIAADFSSGIQRVCAVAPCGAGKTVVVGWMAGKTALVNKRVLFLVHRRELIDQSDRTFTAMNIRHGIISAVFRRLISSLLMKRTMRQRERGRKSWRHSLRR